MYKFKFLGVLLIKSGNYLITDLYIKPTCQYIYTSSWHVFNCNKSIKYRQALILNRICSTSKNFDKINSQFEK